MNRTHRRTHLPSHLPSLLLSLALLAAAPLLGGSRSGASAQTAPQKRPIIIFGGTGGVQLWGDPNPHNNNPKDDNDPVVWLDYQMTSYGWGYDDTSLQHNLTLTDDTTKSDPTYVVPAFSDVNVYAKLTTTQNYNKNNYGLDDIYIFQSPASSTGHPKYFGYFIDEMKAKGYTPGRDLWAYPYDWRQAWPRHYTGVTSVIIGIKNQVKADKVYLVGHSQGTLLITSYLIDNPDMHQYVAGVILIAPPFQGAFNSAVATSKFFGGYDFIDLLGLGISKETSYKICKNSPSMYLMSPTVGYESALRQTGLRGSTVERYRWDNYVSYTKTAPKSGATTAEAHTYMQTFQDNDPLEANTTATMNRYAAASLRQIPYLSFVSPMQWTDIGATINDWYVLDSKVSTSIDWDADDGDGTVAAISYDKKYSPYKDSPGSQVVAGDFACGESDCDHSELVSDPDYVRNALVPKLLGFVKPVASTSATSFVAASAERSAAGQDAPAQTQGRPRRGDLKISSFSTPHTGASYRLLVTDAQTGRKESFTVSARGDVRREAGKGGGRLKLFVRAAVLGAEGDKQFMDIQVGSDRDYEVVLTPDGGEAEFLHRIYMPARPAAERHIFKPSLVKSGGAQPLKVKVGKDGIKHFHGDRPLKITEDEKTRAPRLL